MALTAKVVLVTGGARGIGASIATRFAEEGSFVYVADVDEEGARVLAARLGNAAALRLNVCDRAGLEAAAVDIRREFGGIDVLINNAGVLAADRFDKTSAETWDRLIAVNLSGVFNCVQAFAPLLRGRLGASILNLSSVSADKGGGSLGNVWYGATKAAVIAITKGLARELGPEGIRINAIAPGMMDTEMVRGYMTDAFRTKALTRFPLGRLAEPDDVARLAVFLASDAAGFITGQTVAVDGGYQTT
jgi:NAD(P)-dependent dehydrogenase (short-subunit alcohol dehydrogenase family)